MAMDQTLIKTINKLQDAFSSVGVQNPIDLPQIATTSFSNSSIVPRPAKPPQSATETPADPDNPTPLKPGEDANQNPDERGEFLHKPGEKFFDFNKIREEIVRDTETKTGKNGGISPLPINLRVFSPHVLTLTLIDLPRLTKVPVGDQPRDIEKQIKDMLFKFITKPTFDHPSQKWDPEGSRTIGVLTKVDLMDQGTDVVDILAGRIIPLRLGYVPVVNLIGVKVNTVILMHHIRNTLPEIKNKIGQSLAKYQAELSALGGQFGEPNSSNVVLSIITEFCSDFRTVIDGNSNDLSINELSGGARIAFVFHELFSNGVKQLDPYDQVKDGDIRTILYNSSVRSWSSLFLSTPQILILSQTGFVSCSVCRYNSFRSYR
ncbi:hypothetical protein Pst134EA_030228 [Puccinia striiformis f. sp. tritici]|uniref:hypothetical protein n=1 Tax=Puccinia striiformis f. sp. tritici TaxID=168172 RepID=UPI00200794C5|nr:hypothetical protein Pst134EA_030228 [Puccinia striiformis f. sp. tritici]KAH9446307.1 hypothetical protein Pst134EA_030228 [Puccinia striiformis f. sp. tritici]